MSIRVYKELHYQLLNQRPKTHQKIKPLLQKKSLHFHELPALYKGSANLSMAKLKMKPNSMY